MLLETLFKDISVDEQIYVWRKQPSERRLFDTVEDVLAYARGVCDLADVYFGVGMRQRGSCEVITRLRAAVADVDDGHGKYTLDEIANHIALFPFKPSFLIGSGHGFHVYWLYDTPALPEIAQEASRGFVHTIGSDAVHDPERILRIPGTRNHKDINDVRDVVELLADPSRVYSAADITAAALVPQKILHVISTGDMKGYASRSERDWTVLRALVAAGVSDDGIRTIARQRPCGDRWREDSFRLLDVDMKNALSPNGEAMRRFSSVNKAWFFEGQKGPHQVSTFTFAPQRLLHSKEGGEDVFLGKVEAGMREWQDVTLPRNAFSSQSALLKALTSMHWQWFGSDYETKQLLPYLVGVLYEGEGTEAQATYVIGRHEDYWVTKNLTMSATGIFSPATAPYLYIDRSQRRSTGVNTVPDLTYRYIPDEDYTELVKNLSELIPLINVPEVIYPMLGWFAAAPLKGLLQRSGIRFPILNVFGTMGSGKTSALVNVLMPMLGCARAATNTANTTKFILRVLLSQSNAIPVIFGEFRESTVDSPDFFSTMRMLYDTGMDSRGRADQSTETYMLEAPVVVDGEDAFSDPALRQRAIIVNMHPDDIAEGTVANAAFKELLMLPRVDFAARFIQHTLLETVDSVEKRFQAALEETLVLFPESLPDRVRNNMAVVKLGLKLLSDYFVAHGGKRLTVQEEVYKKVVDTAVSRLSSGTSRTVVDDLVEDLVAYVANDSNVRLPFLAFYDGEANILWFHLTTVVGWWGREQRTRGRSALEAQALRAQLYERCSDRASYVKPETMITIPTGEKLACYGLDLARCMANGMSVPSALSVKKLLPKGLVIGRGIVQKRGQNELSR